MKLEAEALLHARSSLLVTSLILPAEGDKMGVCGWAGHWGGQAADGPGCKQ